MDSFFVNLAITTLISTLKEVVKNPAKKEDLKRAMLKVRNLINAAYAGDPDFD